ncbi:MAG TPA: tetratricopeptide repeat protein [Planctomycetota bacterium]|nr:tetratricopeptide repeat protein [Planctomycetota bacterium]
MDALPPDAVARGYVVLPRPLALPQSRLTADCGPESLGAVLQYWNKPITVQEISHLVRDPNTPGILTHTVGPLARRKGLRATFVEGSVGRLKNAVDRGVPPIIMVASGGGRFHFFVVSGYNDREGILVCEEYRNAKRLLTYAEVEEAWGPAGRFMLELEPSRADDDFLAGADLEAKGRYDEAEAFYRRALEADPDHYEARLGLGNCRLSRGRPEEALEEYRRAQALNPADPKVANNLAHVLTALGRDLEEAERLADRAVALYDAEFRAIREDFERQTQPGIRAVRQKELARAELDLADALGTLGQVRAARGRHDLAVAAWRAALDHYPLTEADARARRHLEIASSLRALSMPAEARRHLERARAEVRDPALRERIEAELK